MGGRRPEEALGQWRSWVLDRCRRGEFTLRGLVGELAALGLKVERLSHKNVWPAPSARVKLQGVHQRIRSQGLNPGQDGMRASDLIKITVDTTFLTRLPKRRLDRYAICFHLHRSRVRLRRGTRTLSCHQLIQ
jgi:hypothetical protein